MIACFRQLQKCSSDIVIKALNYNDMFKTTRTISQVISRVIFLKLRLITLCNCFQTVLFGFNGFNRV